MSKTEEVLQAHRTYFAAHDAGDLATLEKVVHPDYTYFHVNAGLKGEAGAPAVFKAFFESGYGGQVSLHHNEVQLYGDSAVVTCYLSGRFTWIGGDRFVDGTWRTSCFWVKSDSQWKLVHAHASPLAPNHVRS